MPSDWAYATNANTINVEAACAPRRGPLLNPGYTETIKGFHGTVRDDAGRIIWQGRARKTQAKATRDAQNRVAKALADLLKD